MCHMSKGAKSLHPTRIWSGDGAGLPTCRGWAVNYSQKLSGLLSRQDVGRRGLSLIPALTLCLNELPSTRPCSKHLPCLISGRWLSAPPFAGGNPDMGTGSRTHPNLTSKGWRPRGQAQAARSESRTLTCASAASLVTWGGLPSQGTGSPCTGTTCSPPWAASSLHRSHLEPQTHVPEAGGDSVNTPRAASPGEQTGPCWGCCGAGDPPSGGRHAVTAQASSLSGC